MHCTWDNYRRKTGHIFGKKIDYLGPPSWSKVRPAVVDVLCVEDASLRRAEEQRNDPGYSEHRVRLVNGPPVVRERIANGLKN